MKILYLVTTGGDEKLEVFMNTHRVSHEVVQIDLRSDKDYGKIVDRLVESDLVIPGVEERRMKIGILVNTDLRIDDVAGITRAAVEKGHSVDIFVNDEGVRLLCDPDFSGLCALKGVHMSYCDHSTDQLSCKPKALPGEIVCGSQYDNALMGHTADRIIVL